MAAAPRAKLVVKPKHEPQTGLTGELAKEARDEDIARASDWQRAQAKDAMEAFRICLVQDDNGPGGQWLAGDGSGLLNERLKDFVGKPLRMRYIVVNGVLTRL